MRLRSRRDPGKGGHRAAPVREATDPPPSGNPSEGEGEEGPPHAHTGVLHEEPASILQAGSSEVRAGRGRAEKSFRGSLSARASFQGSRPPLGIRFGQSPRSTRLFTVISTREGAHNEGIGHLIVHTALSYMWSGDRATCIRGSRRTRQGPSLFRHHAGRVVIPLPASQVHPHRVQLTEML